MIILQEGRGVNRGRAKKVYKILIRFGGETREAEACSGETLLAVLRRAGVPVPAPCGGQGRCGKCRVQLQKDGAEQTVLACRTMVDSDCAVTPETQRGGAIVGSAGTGSAVRSGRTGLGAALDLGTTTAVLELFDLQSGESRGLAAAWSALAAYGADVISRAQYCMEHPDGAATLRALLRGQTAELLRQLGARPQDLKELFVAGNTVMQHLYAGLDPSPIALAPFTPPTLFADGPLEPGLTYAPCVAGYVGGDITAGLLASGLAEQPGQHLFLDIGTNGEMALGGRDGFLCCAVASGPAFEGAGISCGMPGLPGAVCRVRWTGAAPEFEVIGGVEAKGICGSGLIDLLAVLCEKRLITGGGLLLGPEDAPAEYARFLGEDERGNGVFYLTEDRRVFLTASDVRQLQLAKAAVAAGIRVLLKKSHVGAEEIDSISLAGGFGNSLHVESAVQIGMLPPTLQGKCRVLGNTSLAGARLALLDPAAREKLSAIQRACRYIELSGDADFNLEYTDQLYFYEEEDEEWN